MLHFLLLKMLFQKTYRLQKSDMQKSTRFNSAPEHGKTRYFLSSSTRVKIADRSEKFELFILVYNTGKNGSNKKE